MSPDPHQHMILIKGEVKTQSVREIKNNPDTGGYDVTFGGGKTYSYAKSNIVILKNPVTISPSENRLYRNGEALNNVKGIYVFECTAHAAFGTSTLLSACHLAFLS